MIRASREIEAMGRSVSRLEVAVPVPAAHLVGGAASAEIAGELHVLGR